MSADEVLRKHLKPSAFTASDFRDNHRIVIGVDQVYAALRALRDHGGFDMLVDISAVDYLHYPNATDRYGVVYCLANTQTGERVIVRSFVNDPEPTVPSAYPLWRGADWMEREVYDMYGIIFKGHPDLRRILTWNGFGSYPLRKDYPLRGVGEREDYKIVTRDSA